jgi:uncharacterized phage protein (TIGR02218 family)
MKTASPALIAYLNAARASNDAPLIFADAFVFVLIGGLTLCYTNSDITFTFTNYPAGASFTALGNNILVDGLKYKAAIGLEVDRQQITISARSSDTVSGVPFLQALKNGVFDGTEITRYRVFFTSKMGGSAVGAVLLFKGRLGPIQKLGRTSAQLTVNSDLVLLDIDMPRNLYQPTCAHTLYDSGCTLVKSSFSTNGVVASGSTNTVIVWPGATANFQQGTIVFTSGANAGITGTVGLASTSLLSLIYPLPNVPAVGDTFTVAFGCDHTPGTCNSKFNNLANGRFFPYVPPPQMAF